MVPPTPPPPPPGDASEENVEPTASLHGLVKNPDGGPIFAFVAIERGGLNQENPASALPDGGVQPTVKIDPFYAYGAVTDETGAFAVTVPDEKLGVHVYASGFYCGVPDAGAIDPATGIVVIRPLPLGESDGGAVPAKPTIKGFTVTPEVVMPGETLTMAAHVEAQDPEHDPLSQQVLAIQPTSSWAGVFAPPVPGTWGKGYPNGVYSRLVVAPAVPGEYVYYLLAATEACVVSDPASARVVVSITGDGGLEDAGADEESDALMKAETRAEASEADHSGSSD